MAEVGLEPCHTPTKKSRGSPPRGWSPPPCGASWTGWVASPFFCVIQHTNRTTLECTLEHIPIGSRRVTPIDSGRGIRGIWGSGRGVARGGECLRGRVSTARILSACQHNPMSNTVDERYNQAGRLIAAAVDEAGKGSDWCSLTLTGQSSWPRRGWSTCRTQRGPPTPGWLPPTCDTSWTGWAASLMPFWSSTQTQRPPSAHQSPSPSANGGSPQLI